jgi:hypothetical protein
MGKQSKRPARAAREIHERIREAAEAMRRSPTFQMRDADEYPEVAALMTACREAVEASVPKSVVFEGRTYWLSVSLNLMLDIFGAPGEARPLIRGATFSTDDFGHRPAH